VRRLLLGLLVVGVIALGLFLPGLTSAFSAPKAPDAVGMVQTDFNRDTITLHAGQRLELVNNSNFLHVVTLGWNGKLEQQRGAPQFGAYNGLVTMPHGRVFWTPPCTIPGVYYVTCTIHTDMNLKVVVLSSRTTVAAAQAGPQTMLASWLPATPAAGPPGRLAQDLASEPCG
jgi:plastocyanin